ncbi:MAG: polysaccharide biosynthesis C-terminal domain-containing protein [Bacteroidota bacterium]|nr:polysaccharide biosynthesis C-terminal domain-containing protein [Bacteroidota bacterium]
MGVIKKQGIQNTIVTYFGIILGFVNLIVIQPLFLTPEEIGLVRVLFSFSSLIAVFLPLGIGNITIKYFPRFRNPEKKHHGYFGFMLLFPVMGFLLVTALLYLTRDFFIEQYSDQSALFVEFFDFVFPLSLFLGLINVLNIYSFSLFRTTFPSLLNDVISRVFVIAAIAAYFINLLTLDQFILCFIFIYGFQLILLLLYIFIIDKPSLKVDFKAVKAQNLNEILQYGFLLSFAGIASLGLKYLDSIMIARYLPLAAVGIYTIAAFIPTVIEAPLFALDKIAGTKISQALAVNNTKEIQEIYFKSSRYMLLVGGLLFIGININIHSLLSLLPPEFAKGEMVVLIISIGTFFTMAAGSNTAIIFNSDKYKFGAFLLILLVVIAFISNIILIPKMGIEGAALATAIASFIYNLLKYLFIWKQFKMQPFDFQSLKVLFVIIIVFVIGYFLPFLANPIVTIIYKSIIVTLIYVFLSFLFKVDDELIDSAKKFFK